MWEEYFLQLAAEGLATTVMLAAPILAAGLIAGAFAGMLQSMLQIHDPLLSFIPKVIAVFVVAGLLFPWMAQAWIDYSQDLFSNIPFLGYTGS